MRMSMCMTHDYHYCQRLELRSPDSMSNSIFTKTLEMFLSDSEYREAIEFVGRRKNSAKYRDLMDFMFCELNPEYRWRCFDYYNDKGPLLVYLLTTECINYYDRIMSQYALPIALSLFKANKKVSWNSFKEAVDTKCGNNEPGIVLSRYDDGKIMIHYHEDGAGLTILFNF